MRITQFTDFSLRLLIYLARQKDRVVPIGEVAAFYEISPLHLKKVAQSLSSAGLLRSLPGKNGGVTLNRAPTEINLGQLIRDQENLTLLGCDQCPVADCKLSKLFNSGLAAFLAVFDQRTLADIL